VRFPNVYGIDMPTRSELIATGRSDEDIAREIGADAVIYQELDDLVRAVRACGTHVPAFDTSCFDGTYVTGDVSEDYLARLEAQRCGTGAGALPSVETMQLDLNLAA
jgi:amidophosphoribosyltransferase